MPAEYWWFWIVLAVICFIMEMVTAGFFIFWFGVAALLSLFAIKVLGLGIVWQWVIFIVFSSIGVYLSRKFANKISKKPVKIAAEEVIDTIGIVINELKKDNFAVLAKFNSVTWRCFPENKNTILKIGDKVKALKIEGTHLIVKKEV